MKFTKETALGFLSSAGVFFGYEDPEEDSPEDAQTLNLNDALHWACADGHYVEDDDLPRCAELFWLYGWNGILYFVVVEKRGVNKVEFLDVNRAIQFVKNEEAIRKEEPSSSKRAYMKRQYTLGES